MRKIFLLLPLFFISSSAWALSPAAVNGCQYNGTPPALTDKQTVVFQCDTNGALIVAGATSSGTVGVDITSIGGNAVDTDAGASGAGTLRVMPADDALIPLGVPGTPATTGVMSVQGVASMTPVATYSVATTTGGCTPGYDPADASTNSTAVTGAAATLCSLDAINTTTTIYYLLVFNKATAPTCNSDTPVHLYPIPPASAAGGAGGIVKGVGPFGEAFSAGFAYCITAAVAGTGNAAAGVFVNYATK